MFSKEARLVFNKPTTGEVICQFRFPTILKIETDDPVQFHEQIKRKFPLYQKNKEILPPKIENGVQVPQGTMNNHVFISGNHQSKVNLTEEFICLSTNRYTSWEDFSSLLDIVLTAFISIYKPIYYTRVGLRFKNFVDPIALGDPEATFNDLISPNYLGILNDEEVKIDNLNKCNQSTTLHISGNTVANINSGLGLARIYGKTPDEFTTHHVFTLDFDVFIFGETTLNFTVPVLTMLHNHAERLYRGAITDKLVELMQPISADEYKEMRKNAMAAQAEMEEAQKEAEDAEQTDAPQEETPAGTEGSEPVES